MKNPETSFVQVVSRKGHNVTLQKNETVKRVMDTLAIAHRPVMNGYVVSGLSLGRLEAIASLAGERLIRRGLEARRPDGESVGLGWSDAVALQRPLGLTLAH